MNEWVRIESLSFTWPGQENPCLHDVNFSAAEGERVFVVGASGSGKSTFLNLLAGILRPQSGTITIGGTAMHTMGARALDRFRARHIGLVFQQFNLIPYLDVRTNIRLAGYFGAEVPADDAHIDAVLRNLQLDPALGRRKASQLSVGQQQRVAVARAIINRPRLIIADEPTSALDADSQAAFIDLLLQVQRDTHATVIFVSHDARLSTYFDRVVNLRDLNATSGVAHVA